MREHRNDPKRLKDMVQAIDTIFEYVTNRNMEEFVSDKRTYHAVIYNIMIMGEAANMLTLEFWESHPETQWRQVTNMRNFLIHGYHNVEADLVWEAISQDLLPLREQITSFSTAGKYSSKTGTILLCVWFAALVRKLCGLGGKGLQP